MGSIGIFGGSFDPPHFGHLIACESARQRFNLDKIIWVPSFIPPHKQPPVASARHRLNLLKLALKNNPYFELSDIEIKEGNTKSQVEPAPTYTIDMLKKVISTLGEPRSSCNLFLIIGADEAADFSNWKDYTEILKLCKLIILGRPGVSGRIKIQGAKFCPLNIDISSSQIREFVRKGLSIKYLVPKEVENYIKKEKLYLFRNYTHTQSS